MPSNAAWKAGKMKPPRSSPTNTVPFWPACSMSARGLARVWSSVNPWAAVSCSMDRDAVTGTAIVPRSWVCIVSRTTSASARSPARISPLSSTRKTFSAPVSRRMPRSAESVRTMLESWSSERWNSSAVFEMRASSRYAFSEITSTPSSPRTDGKMADAAPKA